MTADAVRAVVHVAGSPSLDEGQSCLRCGAVLLRTLRAPTGRLLSPYIEGDEIAVIAWAPGHTYTYRVGVLERAGRWTHRTFGEVIEEPCPTEPKVPAPNVPEPEREKSPAYRRSTRRAV